MKKLLVLDNYDSFTYNLVHLIEKLSQLKVEVLKNDNLGIDEVDGFDAIVLSPGPGLPSTAGIMPEVIKRYASKKHILGVCLGMQAIAEAFGSKLKNLSTVYHGLATPVYVQKNDLLFQNCPSPFLAGRYHSWVIDENHLGPDLEITAKDESGHIMAIRHSNYNIRGVQFHPESILSEYGEKILSNWLESL